MSTSLRTYILSGLGVAVVAGLAFVSFRDDPIAVDLAEVTRAPLEVTVNADGHTQVRDLYEVASPIAGTALRSPVAVGDVVEQGITVVAIVQPASSGLLDERTRLQAEAALQEAIAARNVAEADAHQAQETLTFAQSQFDRTQVLVSRNVASLTRLEDANQQVAVATATLDAALARVEMADGAIERARASLMQSTPSDADPSNCCVTVLAPADGIILSVASMSERPVGVGAPLVSLGDPSDLELVADVLSNDAVRLSPGAVAYVERWGKATPLTARLDRIDPQAFTKVSALGIQEQRVNVYFTLESDDAIGSGLGDGFAVYVRIIEWRVDDALQIPLSAIFRVDDAWATFVADGEVARLHPIVLGQRNERMVEIQDGLAAGDRVITHPTDAIADGVSIIERSEL